MHIVVFSTALVSYALTMMSLHSGLEMEKRFAAAVVSVLLIIISIQQVVTYRVEEVLSFTKGCVLGIISAGCVNFIDNTTQGLS